MLVVPPGTHLDSSTWSSRPCNDVKMRCEELLQVALLARVSLWGMPSQESCCSNFSQAESTSWSWGWFKSYKLLKTNLWVRTESCEVQQRYALHDRIFPCCWWQNDPLSMLCDRGTQDIRYNLPRWYISDSARTTRHATNGYSLCTDKFVCWDCDSGWSVYIRCQWL